MVTSTTPGAAEPDLPQRLLANEPGAIATAARWAREITRHHAWGFESPEDVAQETLLALVRNLRDGRFTSGDFRAYVRRIAKNISISSYRRARVRATTIPLEEDMQPAAAGADARVEHGASVGRILAGLDETCRRLIALAYLYGLSRREIAGRLGISEGAAKVRLFRCLERARASQAGPAERASGA